MLLSRIREYKFQKIWRKKNFHNSTTLALIPFNKEFFNQIEIGAHTYGPIWAAWSGNPNERLSIGSYCSIGGGVKFILGSEHAYRSLSTFPFKVKMANFAFEALTKGPILLGDDVWVGENAIILSGVCVGQGAIISAGAVVVKNVPPYAIVGGNPAIVIKFRFDEEICERLATINLCNLDRTLNANELSILYKNITRDNIDEILNSLRL
jgi:acetyltransferase-like isoleucine patch superfamily enzyme